MPGETASAGSTAGKTGAPTAMGALVMDGLKRAASDNGLIMIASGEPALWPVDAALRPEGKNGPLVRTLASHRAYYERWASTWEFQALLKARPLAPQGNLPFLQANPCASASFSVKPTQAISGEV